MTELETFVREELDAFVSHPRRTPDWSDVLRRARPPVYRRPLVLALAAAVAVVGTAAAVAGALDSFDRWLRGQPGKPAPASEQRLFEAENGRSWAAFPKDTKLRELIRTSVGGRDYVLYGFRSGDSLCERLEAVSLDETTQACAPASTLVHVSAPIVPVVADRTYFASRNRPTAEVSFGIAVDGVSRVGIEAVDGMHAALVRGNAYLFVENEPNTGNHVLRVSAVDANGPRVAVSFSPLFGLPFPVPPFGSLSSSPRLAKGPSRIEATIRHPAVRWHIHDEPRGFSIQQVKLTPEQRQQLQHYAQLGFLRLVKPDPFSDVVVGLAGYLCVVALTEPGGAGGSCAPGADFFARGPVNAVIGGGESEFFNVFGVAADGVVRVTIFLADGERQAVPLRNNLFAAVVARTQFPVRVVGYDGRDRIVATQVMPPFTLRRSPAAARRQQTVSRVTGPNGTVGVVRAGRLVRGFHCWRIIFSTGQAPGGCIPSYHGTHMWVDRVQPAGRDLFVIGHVDHLVVRVMLLFTNGDVVSSRTVSDQFLLPIPRAHLSRQRQLAFVLGFDRQGHLPGRQEIVFKLR